ncbi:MAG: hypothetical protein NTZ56_16675 [Acidobacteria bacterium]|nr:hypothetical protein [Acidobacteriota bacterium]
MRGLTDFLITVHVMKGLVGRGPALFGCLVMLAIPVVLLAVLIDQLYPGGFWTFAWKVMVTILKGFHL